MDLNTAILINCSAGNNTGEKKWLSIRDDILEQLPSCRHIITYRVPFSMEACIRELISEESINCIVSAGGDGSANYILNAIVACTGEFPKSIRLGAIGLGSSNDFVKPVLQSIRKIPTRINVSNAAIADMGRVTFTDRASEQQTRYFIVNASTGVTAEANMQFTEGDFVINLTKSGLVNTAIMYTAIKTILKYRNRHVHISYNDSVKEIYATNISVVKNPNISGNLKYDQSIGMNDGFLGLNYAYNMNKLEILRTLYDLQHGRFSGRPKRESVLTRKVKITSGDFLVLETDGEVQYAKDPEFSILPGAIQLLGH